MTKGKRASKKPMKAGPKRDAATAMLAEIALGEDSTRQFKRDVTNADALAAEMVAFANSEGGAIFLGVADDGTTPGLTPNDVKRLNQLIGNTANHAVRSPLTVQTKNVALPNGRLVIVLTVPKGLDKPYFDKNGVIWLKAGADKRRVNSKEELRRLFQITDQFHADELPTRAGLDALDELRFRDFLRDTYGQRLPSRPTDRLRLLANMNLATDDGVLNLAGLLLFGEQPERFKPQFVVKAVKYPGDDIHTSKYDDNEDFRGPLRRIFDDALAFVLRNLRKIQAGRGVNSPGVPEIPPAVFEELLVNALVHRDYLISAPIRLFLFDNRIEIISPGTLPNNLTVENIRAGNSNLRNPILASFVAKGVLPYRGLGSGVPRALEAWPDIDFRDDRDGGLFVATVRRKEVAPGEVVLDEGAQKTTQKTTQKTAQKTAQKILDLISEDASMTRQQLAGALGLTTDGVKYHLRKLQEQGRLRRIGPDKGGRWEVEAPAERVRATQPRGRK